MSTLTVSIIALIVVVIGAVILFNVWQARAAKGQPRNEVRADRQIGRAEARHRTDRHDGPASRTSRGDRHAEGDEPAGNRRWQPGPEQNAWARQRLEPTLLSDDDHAAATAGVAPGIGERGPAGRPVDPATHWDRDDFMTADDEVARDRVHAEETRRAAVGPRESARQAETDAGGFSSPAGYGSGGGFSGAEQGPDGRWDTGPLPEPDEELGPPEFETPRFDAASLERSGPAEPLEPPRFEHTRPFPEGGAAASHPPHVRRSADEGAPGDDPDHPRDPEMADVNDSGADPNAVPSSAYIPAEIDHVVTLIPRAPVNAERLIALTSSLRHVGSKPIRIEIDNGQGRWVPLQSGAMVGCLRCSVLLANRQGPLNAVELSDFTAAVESLAGQIGSRFVPTDMNQVLRQARLLDAAAAKLDTQVDLGVEASAPVTAQKLASVARQLDLVDRGGGRFACFAEGGERLYTLMTGETSDMLAFVLDVPRTPQECDPWRSMVACATSCAQLVGGRIVDGAGRGLSVSMIEMVGQQLQKRYDELSRAGLKAGTPAALRLFN